MLKVWYSLCIWSSHSTKQKQSSSPDQTAFLPNQIKLSTHFWQHGSFPFICFIKQNTIVQKFWKSSLQSFLALLRLLWDFLTPLQDSVWSSITLTTAPGSRKDCVCCVSVGYVWVGECTFLFYCFMCYKKTLDYKTKHLLYCFLMQLLHPGTVKMAYWHYCDIILCNIISYN